MVETQVTKHVTYEEILPRTITYRGKRYTRRGFSNSKVEGAKRVRAFRKRGVKALLIHATKFRGEKFYGVRVEGSKKRFVPLYGIYTYGRVKR